MDVALFFLLIAALVIFFLVLFLRELVLWYFKINQAISLLQDIRDELIRIRATPSPPEPPARSPQ